MAILAGIDLLGKFYAGTDGPGVGPRFRNFVKRYFQPITPEDGETIYQLRNALLHSFGLYSKTSTGVTYHFFLVLPPVGSSLVKRARDSDKYLISIRALYDKFEEAVGRFHEEVQADERLQANFSNMFPLYGTIGIGPITIISEIP
jgi:hypothetical protein